MAQEQVQIQRQEQSLKQIQTISQQQLLQAHLVELPITQLVDRINTEMDDNPALEAESPNDALSEHHDTPMDDEAEDFDTRTEREERQSALDDALQSIGRDDEDLPVYHGGASTAEEKEEIAYGSEKSFIDQLTEEMRELELTGREREVMEYLIGSLDDDGWLRKSLSTLSDELAIYQNIDISQEQLEQVLHKLQSLDPAGIGARDLQECLLLQIDRKDESRVKMMMHRVISDYFDDFIKKRWNHICQVLKLTEEQGEALNKELRKLNPKPGAAMGETIGRNMQQITPDFIVDTQDDGVVTFSLNSGEMPELRVSQSFVDTLQEYQDNKDNMSRQMKEALLYTKKKVDSARNFIEAINMRRRTLTLTMQAIIHFQHRFFEDGDETSLRPMILKDIAERTGLGLSTISRVSNSKYAQTRWGIFPLRYFFSDGYVTEGGEELSTRQIKVALKEIIDAEDKRTPLNDDALKDLLAKKGFPIARRTVAKYREALGIPIARLRK
jgi:RNA polymerase sigma-54 factor